MRRLYVLVEGQTEETFVRELLAPHYTRFGLYLFPILLRTSAGHKGGVSSYGKVRFQAVRMCRQERGALVSTLMDLYALPTDFPGRATAGYPSQGTGSQKARFLEECLARDIDEPNFIPNLMVHEFEAMLFVAPERFSDWTDSAAIVEALIAIARSHQSPEDINNGPHTAPSKRILSLMPRYEKTFHGPLITAEIGLPALREACPHFNAWLLRIEQLIG